MAALESALDFPDEFSDEVRAVIIELGLPEVEAEVDIATGLLPWWDYEKQEWSTAAKPHTIPAALLEVLPQPPD